MKLRAALAALFAAGLVPSYAAAASPHKDAWCPVSVAKLEAFDAAAASNDPEKIGIAAQGVVEAYMNCAAEAQIARNVEPAMNYDKTRAAQFEVVVARSLAAQGKIADAVAAYREARKGATDVADWTPSSMSYAVSNGGGGTSTSRNSSRGTSQYHTAALAVRDAVDAELAKLGVTTAPTGSAAPTAAPAPLPSP
ncbi:MAG: hypothetical protein JOZ24_01040 [Candidatus Eremiobacteraeota bacterium]|nr:hypothetical protein [Candidatus Eremiobacteraeota bacterium]